MLGLAGFIMRGPAQAGLVGATSLVLSLLFPPAVWVAGAAVGLFALRKGAPAGLAGAGLALAGTVLFTWLALQNPGAGLVLAATVWVPVLCVAVALRRTVRLDLSLLLATAFALALALLTFAAVADPPAAWYESLRAAIPAQRVRERLGLAPEDFDPAAWDGLLREIARLMTGMVAAVMLLNTTLSVLLARWWQAALYNPGGFAAEFQALRLGRVAAALALGVCAAAWWTSNVLLVNVALVALTLYLFQGLAVTHGVVRRRRMGRGWLVGLYMLMIFALPQVTLVMAMLGVLDAWLDVRNRLPAPPDAED